MAHDLDGVRSILAGPSFNSVSLGVLMHKSTLKRLKREAAIREVAGTMPAWQVAEHFGITYKTLQELCSRAGISLAFYHKHYSPEEREYVVTARAQGVLVSDIAKKLGRTEGAISALLSNIKLRGYVSAEEHLKVKQELESLKKERAGEPS